MKKPPPKQIHSRVTTNVFGLASVVFAIFVAGPTYAAKRITNAKPVPPTRNELLSQLKIQSQNQIAAKLILARLQMLKANHIATSKLTSPNDKLILAVYDRLINAVDSRQSGDLADFMNRVGLQLAEVEKRNNSSLASFFANLGDVIIAARNEHSDIITTIENYIRAAPISEPLSAGRFILNNSYSNGVKSEPAVGYAREDAAPEIELPKTDENQASSILPTIETPEMLPPMIELESEETTANTADKKNEPGPEKTQVTQSTTPSSDSSAPPAPPAASTLTADSPDAYSASGKKPTLELPLKTE